ncbi:uncharacterized protein KY384_006576 [Bacidia gigantensis]|uniref:uncharacterized protein n=1 Tax=Bacidia gigantensis TaxID=2732470 RepID=UPI001D039DDF|nr:uncharacterized protein KY384_006576 [Bacidia gigantensis]KAG8528887.1 hypothetical protein KY384_006576 [Bacidia gigantensis]
MPFRARVKRALTGSSNNAPYDPSNPLSQPPKRSKKDYPENVYKPGESMPRPKYRGPWNQAHQDRLASFSFGNSWNRRRESSGTQKSGRNSGSEYSPMGSRLPSRGPSRRGSAFSGLSMKGMKPWALSRGGSHTTYDGTNEDRVEEGTEETDDVGNVGLSRQHTRDSRVPPPRRKENDHQMDGLKPERTAIEGHVNGEVKLEPLDTQKTITNGHLFTEDELAKAMSSSTLKSSRRDREVLA